MFEALSDKLTNIFHGMTNRGRLTEKQVDDALRQVRMALLEADVNFKVTRAFVDRVRERSLGREVLESISPGQQVIKIVHEELTRVLKAQDHSLAPSSSSPTVVMLVGLQGSGKTTTVAKLAVELRRRGQNSLLIAADRKRPAAVEQLVTLGKQIDMPVYTGNNTAKSIEVVTAGIKKAKELGQAWVIIDTSGRLHVDTEMMKELADIRKGASPHEVILVVDSMTGQDAVQVAEEFHRIVPLTGLIMTKLDGDSRGGAALSVTQITGVPIKFMGTGENTNALEPFYPDRMASRILGMGDVLTLVEKAEEVVDKKRAKELEKKLRKASFDLEDFLEQLQGLKRIGSIGQFMDMIPGFSQLSKRLPKGAFDEGELKKVEAIIYSMTHYERQNPNIINGSRRKRIALGSGTRPQDINQLINQFGKVQKMMKKMGRMRNSRDVTSLFR